MPRIGGSSGSSQPASASLAIITRLSSSIAWRVSAWRLSSQGSCDGPIGCSCTPQLITSVVTGSPSSSSSGSCTSRTPKGYSWPLRPPRHFRTTSLGLSTRPLNSRSPNKDSTRSQEDSLAMAPRVPALTSERNSTYRRRSMAPSTRNKRSAASASTAPLSGLARSSSSASVKSTPSPTCGYCCNSRAKMSSR
jgi:hypothetical protein